MEIQVKCQSPKSFISILVLPNDDLHKYLMADICQLVTAQYVYIKRQTMCQQSKHFEKSRKKYNEILKSEKTVSK